MEISQRSPVVAGSPDRLRASAVRLEATFLAEMLKSAGFGESRDAFGGGLGEERFSSFLREEHARSLAENGGIGLAEAIYRALKERSDDQG
ncbi:rod-binding protein [Salipiger sp.]|uniref:rod-binding protein n=2 Tax=Salipiger sp. TaxID=2078585 RepID=UPI003A96CFBA